MMNMRLVVIVGAAILAGCRPAWLPMPTQEQAAKIADEAEHTFTSGDPVRIMEHYAPDAVIFGADGGEPTTDPAVAKKWAESFVALKPTKFSPGERKLQILGDHTFISSGVATIEFAGKDGPVTSRVRYTDIYKQQPDRTWLIIHEHLSPFPEARKK